LREPEDNLAFVIECIEAKYVQVRSKEEERIALDGFLAGFARSGKVTIHSDREIAFGGAQGREVVGVASDGQPILARACMFRGRSYFVGVRGLDSEAMKSPRVARFIDSFQLLNLPAPNVTENSSTNRPNKSVAVLFFYELGKWTGTVACVALLVALLYYLTRKVLGRRRDPNGG
jgi:hypothetical protein